MPDLEDMMDGVFEMFDEVSTPAMFQIGEQGVQGHLSAMTGAIEIPDPLGKGPKKYRIRGKLAVSRARLQAPPPVGSTITGPNGTVYRVGATDTDAAGWTFTLATPE